MFGGKYNILHSRVPCGFGPAVGIEIDRVEGFVQVFVVVDIIEIINVVRS